MLPHHGTRKTTEKPRRHPQSPPHNAIEGDPQPTGAHKDSLDVDQRMRRLCLIEVDEGRLPEVSHQPLHPQSRSRDAPTHNREEKVIMLLRRSGVEEADVVLDASFVKAWSIRDPADNGMGLSDPDARVGRNGRSYGLGFKLHSSVEPKLYSAVGYSCWPTANENEKKHAPSLVREPSSAGRSWESRRRIRCLIGDSQYSSRKVRSLVDYSVIPYMGNQRCGEDALRVDRLFRTHGPEDSGAGVS